MKVKAVVLEPRNHFNVDRTLTKQDVKKLIEVNVNLFVIQQATVLWLYFFSYIISWFINENVRLYTVR